MVCEKCEAKLKHVATSDPWKMAGKQIFLEMTIIVLKTDKLLKRLIF